MRLAPVWLVAGICIYFLFFHRIETHAVVLLTPGARLTPAQEALNRQSELIAGAAILALILLLACIWLTIRIIRRYRKSA